MTRCGHEYEDGAYVLGALSPKDRAAFEWHLRDCSSCTRAVGELAGLPRLLARSQRALVVDGRPPVPANLLTSLLIQTRRHRRRRRWFTGLAIAVAVMFSGVCIAVPFGGDLADGRPGVEITTDPPREMRPLWAEQQVSMSLSLTQVGWGMQLSVECAERKDGPSATPTSGPVYALLVIDRDGSSREVASWRAVPGKTIQFSGATSLDHDEIVGTQVTTDGGAPLFELRN